MHKWTIVEMVQNPFDHDHESKDPGATYSWKIKDNKTNMQTGSVMPFAEVEVLMSHFGVSTATGLVGKVIGIEETQASQVIPRLLAEIRGDPVSD